MNDDAHCHCCGLTLRFARKVKIRSGPLDWDEAVETYEQFDVRMTYRWDVVCNQCYRTLDNAGGYAEISGTMHSIAGTSRSDKAAAVRFQKGPVL